MATLTRREEIAGIYAAIYAHGGEKGRVSNSVFAHAAHAMKTYPEIDELDRQQSRRAYDHELVATANHNAKANK